MANQTSLWRSLIVVSAWLAAMSGAARTLAAPATQPAERVAIPGTQFLMAPPAGFTPAENSDGFQNRDAESSIEVTLLPAGSYEGVVQSISAEAFAKKSITLVSKEEMQVSGMSASLYVADMKPAGKDIRKLILVVGDQREVCIVTGAMPAARREAMEKPIREALLSLKWDKNRKVDPMEGLGYSLTPPPSLQVVKRMGRSLMLTTDSKIAGKSANDPAVWVGMSLGENPLDRLTDDQRRELAEARFRKDALAKNPAVEKTTPITVGPYEGFETIGVGKPPVGDKELFVYQAILYHRKHYYIIEARVAVNDREKWLAELRKLTESFRGPALTPATQPEGN